MPRRPDNARIEVLQPLTSPRLRYGSGVYDHSRYIHSGMTWAEARQTPMTNTDWWLLLNRGMIRFVLPDGSALPFGTGPRQPREPRTSTSVVALRRSLTDDSFPEEFTFGIEIECVLPRTMYHSQVAELLNNAGIPTYEDGRMQHSDRDKWKITHDGSVRCRNGHACEIVSPILRGNNGMQIARKVCRLLEENHVKVNKSCGLHVHVGARGQPVEWFKRILQIYAEYEPTIDSTLAPSRRQNHNVYCHSVMNTHSSYHSFDLTMSATTLDELRHAYGTNRYRKVNLEAYWKHGTIEFRHHQGTINPNKVEQWVRFVLAICQRATQEIELPGERSLESLLSFLTVHRATARYHIGRRDYFARREHRLAA